MRTHHRLAILGAAALLAAFGLWHLRGVRSGAPLDAAPASSQARPALPQRLDTPIVPPTGQVIPVPSGGDLQAALDKAEPGDVIELAAGATFVGNFLLPNKPGARWITVRSSAHDRLPPPGSRVSPADAHLMPNVVSPNAAPAVSTATRAHHFRFVGIEVTTTSPVSFGLIHLESPTQTSVQAAPSNIVVDRCYVHGTPSGETRRGVALNGARLAVIDSYLSDFHARSEDSQAIMSWNGPGPLKVANDYLEAAGENVMIGGWDPATSELIPSDIEIRGNEFRKPLSWRHGDSTYGGIPWRVKNLLEFKDAQRVLVDGNIFEQNWVGADQDGFAIVFTPRNQNNTAPWSAVSDVTFTHNIIRRSTGGAYLLGWDNLHSSRQLQRILIQHNLFTDIGAFSSGLSDAGVWLLVSDGPRDAVIDHNTAIPAASPIYASTQVASRWPATGFVFTNNLTLNNQGVSGAGSPRLTLATYFPGSLFVRNVLAGGNASDYPPDNYFPATIDLVGFVNLAGDDYRLSTRSPYKRAASDGTDLGADMDAIAGAAPAPWHTTARP